jgi:hypothetical protein
MMQMLRVIGWAILVLALLRLAWLADHNTQYDDHVRKYKAAFIARSE